MKKHKTGRGESVNGNDGDDEGFESSPEKVNLLIKCWIRLTIKECGSLNKFFYKYTHKS